MSFDKQYKYKISIVMAVYNVEHYVEQSIKCIVEQDMGFKENIQLILIDDGSTDSSRAICEEYRDRYSNNIIYIRKENGGVSSARNLGLNYVEGKYVNFLDSDDLLSKETCREVFNFFEQNYNIIDVVSIPMCFFEGKEGEHILNYKYKKTKIVDIRENYSYIQLSGSSCFIASEALESIRFDEKLKYGEDAKLITQIILQKFTYGVVKEGKYLYRIRKQSKSAIQTSKLKKEWYIETLKNFHLSIIDWTMKKYNYIPKYIQFLLMYDIQWRLNFSQNILNEDDFALYRTLLKRVLSFIDEKIIYEQKSISLEYKNFALYLKNEKHFKDNYELYINEVKLENGIKTYYKDILIDNLNNKTIQIDILKIKNGNLIIEANIQTMLTIDDINLFITINKKKYESKMFVRELSEIENYPLKARRIEGIWNINIPDQSINELKFYFTYKNSENYLLNPGFGKNSALVTSFSKSYYKKDNTIITKSGKTLILFKTSIKRYVGREYRYLLQLIKMKEIKPVLARLAYFITKPFIGRKKIWILMDRADKAQDNGEYLFKYINENCKNIKAYFVLSEESEDFERIKSIGKVLKYGRYITKLYYLHAEKVISSQIDENIINPFGGQEPFYRGLMQYQKVFLQHGITKDDLTKWLNKYNKNIDLFVTVTKDEYRSILENNYYYNADVVKLTGFPRYDYLENRNQKQVLFMPTWRNNLVEERDIVTGKRKYSDSFKESDYFKYWNRLLNNEKIIELCKMYGYKIVFMPHPNIMQQIDDFDKNELIVFADEKTSYNKLFCESSMLITDYSSVAFDCAYLKKPIIYYQFDRDTFFSGHTYSEGYFSYEEMGFGPVCYDEEKFIKEFIEIITKGCKMEEKYIKRVDSFYMYTDKNNCKRVYDEIIRM